ncbi:MAG: hypothetical protein Q9170_007861 [Blastenia crenularia]
MPTTPLSKKVPDQEMSRRGQLGQQAKKLKSLQTSTSNTTDNEAMDTTDQGQSMESPHGSSSPAPKTTGAADAAMPDASPLVDPAAKQTIPAVINLEQALKAATPAGKAAMPAAKPATPAAKPAMPEGTSFSPTLPNPTPANKPTTPTVPKATLSTEAANPANDTHFNEKKRKVTSTERFLVTNTEPELKEFPGEPEYQNCVYQDEKGTIVFSFEMQPMTDESFQTHWPQYLLKVNSRREDIRAEVFNSGLDACELRCLDLRAASTIMPTLVNMQEGLRSRAEKTKPPKTSLQKDFEEKAEMWSKMASACQRQADKYATKAKSATTTSKKATKADPLDDLPVSLENLLGLADVMTPVGSTIQASEFNKLARTVISYAVGLAERFRQELLPVAAFIRKEANVLMKDEHRLIYLYRYFGEAIMRENPRKYFFPHMMEVISPHSHLCTCLPCKAGRKEDIEMDEVADNLYNVPEELCDVGSRQVEDIETYFNGKQSKSFEAHLSGLEQYHEENQIFINGQDQLWRASIPKNAARFPPKTAMKAPGSTMTAGPRKEAWELYGSNTTASNSVSTMWNNPGIAPILEQIGATTISHWSKWFDVIKPLKDDAKFYDIHHDRRMMQFKLDCLNDTRTEVDGVDSNWAAVPATVILDIDEGSYEVVDGELPTRDGGVTGE